MFMKTPYKAISVILAIAIIVVTAGCLTPAADDVPPKKIVPELNQAQREAIVADANQALRKYERKKDAPDDIDAGSWGEAIAKLKPIRVRNDRVNVAIVLSEKDGIEEGLYVSIPISSYAAQVGDRFALITKLSTEKDKSFGTLYHYKLQPKAK
jgi:hypothetical protein